MAPVVTPDRCPGCGGTAAGCYCVGDGWTFAMVEELHAEMEEEWTMDADDEAA